MEGDYLHIYFNLITIFNLLIMSEKIFQTSNRQFGVALNAELKRHAIKHNYFMCVKKVLTLN